jgi:carbon-monoxide dehydrogenase small subunit
MEAHGLQCGFCTPIPDVYLELLAKPRSVRRRLLRHLGNICRCTGYQSIIEAVRLAASKMRETASSGKMDGMQR